MAKYFFLSVVLSWHMDVTASTDFKNKLLSTLSYASKIKYNENLLEKELVRPAGTWQRLLVAKSASGNICLFYKTPHGGNLGKLRLGQNCQNAYDRIHSELGGVEDFFIAQGGFETVLKFHLSQAIEWRIPHFNLISDKEYQRYDSPVKVGKLRGLLMGMWPVEKFDYMGKLSDNYKDGTAAPCHQVNSECENVIEYSCNKCRFGHFEVVDFKCPQGGSKYCGQSRCGERGHPACPRGYAVLDIKETACIPGWRAGFCQRGLNSYCDSKNVLICR